MKYLIYISIIIFSCNSCNAQKKVNMEQDMIIPQVNKNFETIDPTLFNEKGAMYTVDDDDQYTVYTSANIGYGKTIFYNNSYFKSLTSYYKNKKYGVRKKGIMFINGSKYGIWYEFNEKGELVREINTDEGYEYQWEDIIEYCVKNNIRLTSGYPKSGGVKTEIYKTELESEKVWQITFYDYDTKQLFEVTLDGKTGNEIKKRELEFIGG